MKKIVIGLVLAMAMATGLAAQGSLSSQVLQLLTRNNTWSGLNTYVSTVGLALQRGAAPTTTTDTLYNVGGNLYFNGVVLASSSSAGTVTSVGLTMPSIMAVTNSPVTSSGTLAVSLANQSVNTIFAGPGSGSAGTPTFRNLVAADIPNISATYLTPTSTATLTNKSGNISQWTNDSGYLSSAVTSLPTLAAVGTITSGVWNGTIITGAYGGTGVNNSTRTMTIAGNLTTAAAFTTSGANALTLTTTGATNVTLPTTGTLVNSAVTTLSSLVSVGTITSGTWSATAIAVDKGGTNIASYAVGDVLYASGATTLSKLADVATGNALISGGVTTAPSWGKVGLTTHVSGTLPLANGGTGLTTAADDTVMVSSGTAWVAKALTTGVVSYDTSTNAFSVPTTFILGTGAPTPSVNNILLRSNVNGLLEVMLGNASAYAWMEAGKLAIGNAVDDTFNADYTMYNEVWASVTGTVTSKPLIMAYNLLTLSPSADTTQYIEATRSVIQTSGVRNFDSLFAFEASSLPAGSGTVAYNVAGYFASVVSGVGTATVNIGIEVGAAGSGSSIITNNYSISVDPPTVGMTLTNHYGIYLYDQTVTSTLDYAFYYAAPSSKEFAIQADGEVFIGALKTTGAAASKKVVCVDTATGKLYASSSDTACAN